MKETFYFSHDYNARQDPKIIELQMVHGMAGIGIYWCLIELLYENGGYLKLSKLKTYAYSLRVEQELIKSVIDEFDLFVVKDDVFYSASVIKRLEERKEKSDVQRNNISKRWNKKSETAEVVLPNEYQIHTNGIPTEYQNNTLKESKVKEIKEKESKVKESKIEPNLLYSTLSNFIFECKDKKVTLSNGEVQDLITKYPKINVHNKLEYLSAYLKKPDAKKPLSKNLMTLINTKFDNWNSDGDVPIPKQRYPLLK